MRFLHPNPFRSIRFLSGVLAASLTLAGAAAARQGFNLFAKSNLVAWCIVPFDAKHRGPEERAEMLSRLGITKLAYDWRDKDIPTFDQELDALQKHHIKLQAFWLVSGPDVDHDKNVAAVFDFLKRRKVRTEIWYLLAPPPTFASLTQEQKVEAASKTVRTLATKAKQIGCKIGLYNHGGWFGEPENQLAIIRQVKMGNVGMIYNFHHGREQMDRFSDFFPKIVPHLLAVNLNGMKKDASFVLPIGSGDREIEMMKLVKASGYRGPIGILGHREELDAEVALQQNIDGLKNVLSGIGDTAALKTY